MELSDVRRFALVLSVSAEIEGMKAENTYRKMVDASNAYHEAAFISKAEELKNLAYCDDTEL